LNYCVGVFTGVALVCSLANLLALWRLWPGVLSFWNWVVVVLKDWLLVTCVIVLCVWRSTFFAVAGYFTYSTSYVSDLALSTLSIAVGVLLPAIAVWQVSASVVARARMIMSGE
jgi:hypothetical protein